MTIAFMWGELGENKIPIPYMMRGTASAFDLRRGVLIRTELFEISLILSIHIHFNLST